MSAVRAVDYAPGPQSGGREPAPGRLALVQAFANTFFDLDLDPGRWGRDQLATAEGLAGWLAARGLLAAGTPVTTHDHARALAVREGLRTLLAGHNGHEPDAARVAALRAAAEGLCAGVAVDGAGRTLPVPASPDADGALGLVLALVREAEIAGAWSRLKACPGHGCGWAFYDHSRNQASTWCSARVCGSREKARAYRRRSRG